MSIEQNTTHPDMTHHRVSDQMRWKQLSEMPHTSLTELAGDIHEADEIYPLVMMQLDEAHSEHPTLTQALDHAISKANAELLAASDKGRRVQAPLNYKLDRLLDIKATSELTLEGNESHFNPNVTKFALPQEDAIDKIYGFILSIKPSAKEREFVERWRGKAPLSLAQAGRYLLATQSLNPTEQNELFETLFVEGDHPLQRLLQGSLLERILKSPEVKGVYFYSKSKVYNFASWKSVIDLRKSSGIPNPEGLHQSRSIESFAKLLNVNEINMMWISPYANKPLNRVDQKINYPPIELIPA